MGRQTLQLKHRNKNVTKPLFIFETIHMSLIQTKDN